MSGVVIRRLLAGAGLTLGVIVLIIGGWSGLRSSPSSPGVLVQSPAAPPSVTPATPTVHPTGGAPAPVTPSSSSTPSPSSTSTAEPRATSQPRPATRVLHLEVPSAGYVSDVGTMEVAGSGVINPPDFVHTWWVRDRGVVPSSRATDTSYLACHTHSQRTATEVPCNVVEPDAVPVGSPVQVITDAERLTYRVTAVRKIPKDEFAHDEEVWGVHPGRLVWVTCYLNEGRRSEFNIVVFAELATAQSD